MAYVAGKPTKTQFERELNDKYGMVQRKAQGIGKHYAWYGSSLRREEASKFNEMYEEWLKKQGWNYVVR